MASVRSTVSLPDSLRCVLDMRTRTSNVCPPDVVANLGKIPFFRSKGPIAAPAPRPAAVPFGIPRTSASTSTQNTHANVRTAPAPVQSSGGNRFTNLSHCAAPEGWRNVGSSTHTPPAPASSPATTQDDGFEVWTSRKRRGPTTYTPAPVHYPVSSGPRPTDKIEHVETTTQSSTAWKSSRYQPVEAKIASESVEDRIMGKVKAKVNKIGESTYDATKAFMQQILDSGETGFLDEFMKFVFQKAATEPSFCGLYAKLLHELADEFGHLRTEMQSRFRDYTSIFTETEKTPDVETADYAAFVEAQERKKFRRGYSQFVAELAKIGEVDWKDFQNLVLRIVQSIKDSYTIPENTLLCEEYIDCLSKMCMASASVLAKSDWIKGCMEDLQKIVDTPRTTSPGLTNKGRFALMDILDFAKKGWRS